jgi:Cys-tRNA(Pro) deacylase
VSKRVRSVEKVRRFLREHGIQIEVRELAESTKTAPMAAKAVGAPLGSIVKSLLFLADGRPILVLVAGDRRADLQRIAELTEAQKVRIADAETVRHVTGYAIGGVPPVGHKEPLPTLVDDSLLRYDLVYAAAGAPNAIFAIPTQALLDLVGGEVADLSI